MGVQGEYIRRLLDERCDVRHHLPTLRRHAEGCRHVTEMGVRGLNSTWAFLAARPVILVLIDWDRPPFEVCRETLGLAVECGRTQGTEVRFVSADSTSVVLDETDLLFIDTWHTYEQLLLELLLHSDHVRRKIIAHDTSEAVFPGMSWAITDFVGANPHWKVLEHLDDYPGLTVLDRVRDGRAESGPICQDGLRREIARQQEIYYAEIGQGGSTNPLWKEYRKEQYERFQRRTT